MNFNNYLPIGSVCLLKGAKKRVMIIGYSKNNRKIRTKYDYVGCEYPTGVTKEKEKLYFLHSKIDKIFFIGYNDIEQKELLKNFDNSELLSKENNINNVIVNKKGNGDVSLLFNDEMNKSQKVGTDSILSNEKEKTEIMDLKRKEIFNSIPTQ